MTKALFFDIDGTLVSFETHRIPSSTIEALEAAHAKGLKIFIATGRPKAIINNLSELQDRNLIDGYITMNGAYCFVGETSYLQKRYSTVGSKSNGCLLREKRSSVYLCGGTQHIRLPA